MEYDARENRYARLDYGRRALIAHVVNYRFNRVPLSAAIEKLRKRGLPWESRHRDFTNGKSSAAFCEIPPEAVNGNGTKSKNQIRRRRYRRVASRRCMNYTRTHDAIPRARENQRKKYHSYYRNERYARTGSHRRAGESLFITVYRYN